MSETLGPGENEIGEESEDLVEIESRFGDKESLGTLLQNGEPHILGSIDELREVEPHMNIVELVELETLIAGSNAKNEVKPIFFDNSGGEHIFGIFKPVDGEDPYVKEQYKVNVFAPREALAYTLSEHFGFDLVPPTVLREIDGRLGSIQLYLPHEHYQTIDWVEKKSQQSHFDFARGSIDWEIMAAFDYIIANPDRHAKNVMVNHSTEGNQTIIPQGDYGAELIAIDNGTSLSTSGYYSRDVRVVGPNADMTYSVDEHTPLQLDIPEYLKAMIKRGTDNAKSLDIDPYRESINTSEFDDLWQRAQELVKHGVFMSRYNERSVRGY